MVNQDQIFAPMGALAALTFSVLALVPLRRIAASRRGEVSPGDFRYGESARVSGKLALPNRNYMNLLEVPTLFYAVCLLFFVAHRVDPAALTVAWLYFALRVVHTAIHLTYNNVLHRLGAFALSVFALIALWVMFFVRG